MWNLLAVAAKGMKELVSALLPPPPPCPAGFVWHTGCHSAGVFEAAKRVYGDAGGVAGADAPEIEVRSGGSIWRGRDYSASKHASCERTKHLPWDFRERMVPNVVHLATGGLLGFSAALSTTCWVTLPWQCFSATSTG